MTFSINTDHESKKVFIHIKNQSNKTRRAIRQGFYFVGKDLTKTSQQLIIKGPKTGRVYKVAGRLRRHRASAPGEAPANLKGNLQKSIGFTVKGSDSMEFGSQSGSIADPYASVLESGNKSGTLQPRPYLKPSVEGNERNTKKHLERELAKELNKR